MLSSCASLPSQEVIQQEIKGYQLPALPKDDKALVYIVRPSSLGKLVRFKVFVDQKDQNFYMGYTRGKQYIYFYVSPGEHEILSKAENLAKVKITAKKNEIIFLQQNPRIGIFFARNKLFNLKDYEGKYHVKKLKLGTIKQKAMNQGRK